MSTRKVTLTADTTRYQEALERVEALATFDREQRRYRTPPGLRTDVTDEAIETHAAGRTWPRVPEMGGLLAETASAQVRQIALCMGLEEDEVRKALVATVAAFTPVATWDPGPIPVRPIEHVLADIAKAEECDRHRPLGPDGKHGDRHTSTCGCREQCCDCFREQEEGRG